MPDPQLSGQTVTMISPDGSLGEVPAENSRAALSAGGKLAVWMKSPDGTLGVVPHDQVYAAKRAGGTISEPPATSPNKGEGFWHSLGSALGLTAPDEATQKEMAEHPIKYLAKSTLDMIPGTGMIHGIISSAPGLIEKGGAEHQEALDALKRGDISGFAAHSLGAGGYMASIPFAGAPAKAGEQLGSGDVSGAAGTAIGIFGPMAAAELAPVAGKVGSTVKAVAKPAVKAGIEAIQELPGVKPAIAAAKAYKDVPGQVRDIWQTSPQPAATVKLSELGSVPSARMVDVGQPAPPAAISPTATAPVSVLKPVEQSPASSAAPTAPVPTPKATISPIPSKDPLIGGSGDIHEIKLDVEGQQKGSLMLREASQDSGLPPKTARIASSMLLPELQGKGFGSTMYDAAAKYAKAQGADYLASDSVLSPQAERMWESISKQDPGRVSVVGEGESRRFLLDLRDVPEPETDMNPFYGKTRQKGMPTPHELLKPHQRQLESPTFSTAPGQKPVKPKLPFSLGHMKQYTGTLGDMK